MNAEPTCLLPDSITLGPARRIGPLTLFPLLVAPDPQPPDYLTLEEALPREWASVREIGEGIVPEILVENRADLPLLLLEGQELIGAKQNRVLNLSLMIAPHSRQAVPVSCVERGRWSGSRQAGDAFRPADHHLFAAARRVKVRAVTENLRASGRAVSDQGQVWSLIADKSLRMQAHSETDAVDALYEAHAGRLESLLSEDKAEPGEVGVLVGIGSSVAGLDLVDHPATWARISSKVIKGYGIDALEESGEKALSEEGARTFLDSLRDLAIERRSSPGVGGQWLFRTERAEGAALAAEGRVRHLFAFTGGSQAKPDPRTRRTQPQSG